MPVEVKGLCKAYGGKMVFENISFSASPGNPAVIMGASGSGKTTVLRILLSLEKADSGKAEITGEKTGVVFQEPRLLKWSTALENAMFAVKRSEQNEQTAKSLFARMGLEGCEKMYPDELSGGMKQRVALIRALLYKEALITDEPTSGLDDDRKTDVMSIIKEYSEKHTVVMVTHDRREAEFINSENIVYLK